MDPLPGDVLLRATKSTELDEARRVIVVSASKLNRGDYVVVVPVTSSEFERRRHISNNVPFEANPPLFNRDCVAQAEGISVIKKIYLRDKVGQISDEQMRDVIRAIAEVIDSECEPLG
jgi:mRNA-degrading endonuclease toxin of MazEF toxin-antitoxin module